MRISRLKKLADFLENLPPEKFYFGSVIRAHENGCGTVACAMGWTPQVFPELVQWREVGTSLDLCCPGIRFQDYTTIASKLFDISGSDATDLFTPNSIRPWNPEEGLPNSAAPKAVAKSIRDFIRWKEAARHRASRAKLKAQRAAA